MVCGLSAELEVPLEGLRLWQAGVLIQDAFPGLDQGERELLMTGTHDRCWQEMWNLSALEEGDARQCDQCGAIEDAGEGPDQDGLGRSECCSEVE
jgi:hypothetical protein